MQCMCMCACLLVVIKYTCACIAIIRYQDRLYNMIKQNNISMVHSGHASCTIAKNLHCIHHQLHFPRPSNPGNHLFDLRWQLLDPWYHCRHVYQTHIFFLYACIGKHMGSCDSWSFVNLWPPCANSSSPIWVWHHVALSIAIAAFQSIKWDCRDTSPTKVWRIERD